MFVRRNFIRFFIICIIYYFFYFLFSNTTNSLNDATINQVNNLIPDQIRKKDNIYRTDLNNLNYKHIGLLIYKNNTNKNYVINQHDHNKNDIDIESILREIDLSDNIKDYSRIKRNSTGIHIDVNNLTPTEKQKYQENWNKYKFNNYASIFIPYNRRYLIYI